VANIAGLAVLFWPISDVISYCSVGAILWFWKINYLFFSVCSYRIKIERPRDNVDTEVLSYAMWAIDKEKAPIPLAVSFRSMRFHIRRLVLLALSSTCLAVVFLNTLRPRDAAEDSVQFFDEPPVQVEQKQVRTKLFKLRFNIAIRYYYIFLRLIGHWSN